MIKIIFSVSLAFISFASFAQLVHVEGSRTINISGGITGQGVNFQVGHSRYATRNLFMDYNLGYEQGQLSVKNTSGKTIAQVSDYMDIEINAKVNYSLYRWKNLYINPSAGISLGYEQEVSNFDKNLSDQAFGGGFIIGANVEYWNLANFGFKISFDQYLKIISLLGNKYNINLSMMYNL